MATFNNSSNLWKIAKHEYVEITLAAGNTPTRIQLPDLKNLRYCHLRGLSFYTEQDFTNGIQNIPTMTRANMQEAWLTLQLYNGKEFTHQVPLLQFFNTTPFGNYSPRDFLLQKVNWPKSYIDFNAPIVLAEERVIAFSIYYNDKAKIEKQDGTYGFMNKA